MKILVPVDGSKVSTDAVRHAARLGRGLGEVPDIILMYVDPPLKPGIAAKLGAGGVQQYHDDNSRVALRSARSALGRAHLAFSELRVVGDPAESIVREAKKNRCDLIVIGSHGRGALQDLLLGSVASKVIAHSGVPVTLVR